VLKCDPTKFFEFFQNAPKMGQHSMMAVVCHGNCGIPRIMNVFLRVWKYHGVSRPAIGGEDMHFRTLSDSYPRSRNQLDGAGKRRRLSGVCYGVATTSRHLKIIGLFRRI